MKGLSNKAMFLIVFLFSSGPSLFCDEHRVGNFTTVDGIMGEDVISRKEIQYQNTAYPIGMSDGGVLALIKKEYNLSRGDIKYSLCILNNHNECVFSGHELWIGEFVYKKEKQFYDLDYQGYEVKEYLLSKKTEIEETLKKYGLKDINLKDGLVKIGPSVARGIDVASIKKINVIENEYLCNVWLEKEGKKFIGSQAFVEPRITDYKIWGYMDLKGYLLFLIVTEHQGFEGDAYQSWRFVLSRLEVPSMK